MDHPSTRKALKGLSDKLSAYIGPSEAEEEGDKKEEEEENKENISEVSSRASSQVRKFALKWPKILKF